MEPPNLSVTTPVVAYDGLTLPPAQLDGGGSLCGVIRCILTTFTWCPSMKSLRGIYRDGVRVELNSARSVWLTTGCSHSRGRRRRKEAMGARTYNYPTCRRARVYSCFSSERLLREPVVSV